MSRSEYSWKWLIGFNKEIAVMKQLRSALSGRLIALCTFALLAGVMGGCAAEEVGDIDRTQANKLEKKSLSGVWLYLQTMVDVPQQSAQGFIGNTNFGNTAKVMFDVQEHYVYVYPVVETVQFAEAEYTTKKIRNYWDEGKSDQFLDVFVGQPLAVYPVISHFDVIRQYNAATGKQSNVLIEDTTENVWHKRKYMRVNWGGNVLMDWGFTAGTVQFSPVDHYVTEDEDPYLKKPGQGDDPDRIEFKEDYIGFVTKAYMPPSGRDWQGYSCNSFGVSNKDCAGSVIKVRHSFKRAPATPDYEVAFFPNYEHMDKFGFFRADRYAYDELWNITVHNTDYKATRWNLWQTTWNYEDILDENENTIACMNHDDCGADEKVLDETTFRCLQDDRFKPGKCTKATLKPHKERGLKPIIYHLSATIQEELRHEFYEAAEEWSVTFKEVVAWLYALEDSGQYWTRTCNNDSDCTAGRDDVLLDTKVDVPVLVPQTSQQECEKNASLGYGFVSGKCVKSVPCSVDNDNAEDNKPCAKDQLCKDNVCMARNEDGSVGSQILEDVMTKGYASTTGLLYRNADGGIDVIIAKDDKDLIASQKTPDGQDKAAPPSPSQAIMRFVNASPDSGAVKFKVGRKVENTPGTFTTEWSSTISAEFEFDAKAIVNQLWLVDASNSGVIGVEVGGKTIEAEFQIEGKFNYLVAFVGGDSIVMGGTNYGISETGMRFLHGIKDQGPIDVGLTSVRAAESLNFGEMSNYIRSSFDEQRITVLEAGREGDVTCFHHMHEGRCIGWSGSDTDTVKAAYDKYMQELPDMFVVCENIYDVGSAAAKYEEAQSNPAAFHDGRYMSKGTNPYNTKIGDTDNQTLANGDQYFNPCEHFVRDPYELKKIGDVRYNYMYWVGEAQASSPLGYGPSAGDPETGETFWATAYVYGAPTQTYGQFATDMVNILNGNFDTNDIITGKYIKDYIERKGDPLPMDNSGGNYYGGLKIPETLDLQAQFDLHPQFDHNGHIAKATDPFKSDMAHIIGKFATDEKFRKQLLSGLPTVKKGFTQERLARIKGTYIEDLMVNEEVRAGLSGGSLLPGEEVDEDMFSQLSPLSWASGAAQTERREMKRKLVANAPCTFDREFVDDNLYGLAKEFVCNDDEKAQWEAGTLEGKKCLTGDALRWEITGRLFGGVMEHEIGHTVGLRHNFSGSVDLMNFKDEYYGIREKQLIYCEDHSWCDDSIGEQCTHESPCAADGDCRPGLTCAEEGFCVSGTGTRTGVCTGPVYCSDSIPCGADAYCKVQESTSFCHRTDNDDRVVTDVKKFIPRPFMTDFERTNKMSEYQYSTVMDYGGRWNSDIHGLGKYDKAAIRFGYGKLVDVYNNTSRLRNRIHTLASTYGFEPSRYSYMFDTTRWRFAGVLTSGFAYMQDYIGEVENLDRRAVPYEKVKLEHQMQSNYDDENLNFTYVEVPYRFCSDEYRGNLNCYYFDTGADMGEIVYNAVNQVDEYYVWDAFKRDRMYRGSNNFINYYFGRVLDRFLSPLGDAGRYWAIYDHIFREYGASWDEWTDNVLGPRTLKDAAKTSFNHLAKMLAGPAPGSYMKDPGDRVYRNVTYDIDDPTSELTIPVGVGKFPYTQWMDADNYGYQNHVVWVGSFWLKLAALMTLTDSTFYSSSDWVGEQLDIGRSSAVGFSTLYPRELTNLVGGIVAESLDHYSGVVEQDAEGKTVFRARDLFDFTKDQNKDLVEPGMTNLTMKLWSAVLGLSNIPAGFDPSFIDSMTVYVKGSGYEYDLIGEGGGVKKAEFNDPFGAKTYVAYTPNYDQGRLATAYEIVVSAQALREQWDTAVGQDKELVAEQLKDKIQMLDIMRELHYTMGYLEY